MPDMLKRNYALWKILTVIVLGLVFITQSIALYLSTTKENARNLMVIEKAPVRVIMRWDTLEEELEPDIEKTLAEERIHYFDAVMEHAFHDYSFNETLNVNIRTETIKADTTDLDIKETETLTTTTNNTEE